MAISGAVALVPLLSLLCSLPLAAADAPPAVPAVALGAAELPATGAQKTLLTVDRYGRYSIRVENPQGSSVELIDRMAGSLGSAGVAGKESGRLDLFLDRGQYQLRIASAEKGSGKVRVQARSFRELHPSPAPRLIETRLVEESLDDLEQASYWVEVGARGGVRIEAAGRNLADLRLWKDGAWLTDVEPRCQQIQPAIGTPLWRCRLAAVLEPGFYLLTAYGGVAQPWAAGGEEHPLYVRWGEPRLPESGRRRYEVSPFGEDHFRVPDKSNFFRIELPEARPAGLRTGWLRPGSQYEQETATAFGEVTKETVPPAVEMRANDRPGDDAGEPELAAPEAPVEEAASEEESYEGEEVSGDEGSGEEMAEEESYEGEEGMEEPGDEPQEAPAPAPVATAPAPLAWERLVTVTGAPGQPYVLQHFEQRDVYTFTESGPYWVSTVHAGSAGDSVDATAILTDTPPGEKEKFLASAALPLDLQTSWSRRFNFQDTLTLFLEAKENGTYRIATSGVEARVRVEPFFLRRPNNYAAPKWQGARSSWNLAAGYYVLTLEPVEKGILTLTLGEIKPPAPATQPAQGASRFFPLGLESTHTYTAYFNRQPGVTSGLVLRPWPLDLGQPLPVAQKPGEVFEVTFRTPEEGTLRAEAEDAAKLEVSVDGGPWVTEAPILPGEHRVAVRHDRPESVNYSLWVEPLLLKKETPLPPIPDAALAALPQLPVLSIGAPRAFDLERGQQSSWLVQAGKPGLYAVRSTGLLATAGTLRTRTVPSLRREEQNGVGRNFLVQQYLREGDYQVTVAALGQSAGHAGIALESTPLLDGGTLRPGMPGHFTLPAGQAVLFQVAIPKAGRYTLRGLGLGFTFLSRFEDSEGWPLRQPNTPAELDSWLEAGTYRFLLLPQPVEARALVLLERQPEPLVFQGHGPHVLPLEIPVEHVWVEPEGEDTPRPPDLWQFEVPAQVHAAVELTEEMQGRLNRVGSTEEIGFVPPGRAWKGELAPGRYQLAAECSRRNSLVRYRVTVHTDELVTGLERTVTAPAEVAVSIGRDGLAELTSISPADVRARLLDAEGRVVAENDDRPDDWNFLLFQRLAPGRYTLKVEPVGAESAEVRIALRTPAEVEQAAASLPFSKDVQLGGDVQVRPLPVTGKADLLLVAARSKDSLGLSVEARSGSVWQTVGTSISREAHLEIPLDGKAEYRLRLWSLDRQESPSRLSVAAIPASRIGERELRRGANLSAVKGFEPSLAAAVVSLDSPGVFRFADPGANLRGSGLPGRPLAALGEEGAMLSSPGQRFWLVRSGKGGTVKAERVTVATGLDAGTQFPVPDGTTVTADLSETKGGPVLALATSPAGQPGLRIAERGDAAPPQAQTMAVGPRTALAVALDPRHPVARVWQAGDAGEEIQLAQLGFPETKGETAQLGVIDGLLEGIAARRLDLPSGPSRLRLALGDSTAAVLSRGETVLSTHWQGGTPFEEVLDSSSADRLTLFHLRPEADPYSLELLPGTGESLALAPGAPFERSLDRAGTLRVALPVGGGALHVRGANASVTLLGSDGVVRRGLDLPVSSGVGGVALIRHEPGLLLAWLGAGDETAALWPQGIGASPVKVAPPASVPLSARFAELTLSGAGPRVLHLRSAQPLATLIHRPDGSRDEVEVHPEAGRLDAFLPAGESRVGLRALAGAQLSGVAEVTETPVTPIGEGLGPEVLLAAGASRWFSFRVERQGPVGIGAHAGADVVEIDLYDRAGHPLQGEEKGGVIRMPDLAPGDYLLELHAPAAAAPVRARPALAGLVLPDTGPPEEVIQQYLQEAGAEVPESVSASQGSQP